jgi:DNA-binding MarR family transcriptional regulator
MHFLAFAFKRAHYTSVRLGRPHAVRFGLTPARFDMLYAIRLERSQCQASLARMLGVAGVTVSRMLRKLEALGFIRRETRSWFDRRMKLVSITALGRKLLSLTSRKMKRRSLQRAFMRVIPPDPRFGPFFAVDELYSTVRSMMQRLGDRATLEYPTMHPDD